MPLFCDSLYMLVVAKWEGAKYPEKARELWACQMMIIGESRKCGEKGWLLYDATFRQQERLMVRPGSLNPGGNVLGNPSVWLRTVALDVTTAAYILKH
jgi:hypothetical protein